MSTPVSHQAVLAHHGRSFHLAGQFLPPDRLEDAALLYHFCRLVDDTADEAPDVVTARVGLGQLRAELLGEVPAGALVGAFLAMAERCQVPLGAALELIEGVSSDLEPVRFRDDAELLRYCYRVAGTVGLMMCGVLGVEDRRAWPHAVDLGVGMQLTNICRDVLEDGGRGRVYLPADRLRQAGGDPSQLAALPALDPRPLFGDAPAHQADPQPVRQVVSDLLQLAEEYYDSGREGLAYIPFRSRVAIAVAAQVYRAIGRRLLRHGGDPLRGRMVVPGWEKAWVVTRSLASVPLRSGIHREELHRHLSGLPGCRSLPEGTCLTA